MTIEEGAYLLDVALTNEDTGRNFSQFTETLEEGWTLLDDGTPDFGHIYRLCQREYGRCTGSVYVDREGRPPARVGWFFVKRAEYSDYHSTDTYLHGAWVSVARVVEPARPRMLEHVER